MIMAIAALLILATDSVAFGGSLRTEAATAPDTRTYTLILFGNRYFKDIENVAFLDVEGDGYLLEPYAPEFDYRVIKNLSAREAIEKAERFVSSHYDFWHSELSRILDNSGKTLGYELRPLYRPLAFGIVDVMDIDYALKGDRVRIYIHLKPKIDRHIFGGDGSSDRDR